VTAGVAHGATNERAVNGDRLEPAAVTRTGRRATDARQQSGDSERPGPFVTGQRAERLVPRALSNSRPDAPDARRVLRAVGRFGVRATSALRQGEPRREPAGVPETGSRTRLADRHARRPLLRRVPHIMGPG